VIEGGQSVEEGALSREDMRTLYSLAHVFVLPTRGEGWGLPCVEAMAMQLPVIVTNFSGPTAYLGIDNSFPLDYKLAGGMVEPDAQHLVRLMLHVYTHRHDANEKGLRAREHILRSFSPENVTALMFQRIRHLAIGRWGQPKNPLSGQDTFATATQAPKNQDRSEL
jgi:glycosyltransferase involved in cell wall biosynthesis